MPREARFHHFKVTTIHTASSFAVDNYPYFKDPLEKGLILDLLSNVAFFSNVKVFEHQLEDSHIHLIIGLCEDPDLREPKEVLLERIKRLYKPKDVARIERTWETLALQGDWLLEEELNRWRVRMNSYSMFMKTFLQRFTQNYNARHNRKGTLWRERFSCPHLASEEAVRLSWKYIQWNPQRNAYNLVCEQMERCKELLANPLLSLEELKKVHCENNRLQAQKEDLEEATRRAGIPLAFLEYNPSFTCAKFLGTRERLQQLIRDRPYTIHHVLSNLFCVGGWAVKVKKLIEKRE